MRTKQSFSSKAYKRKVMVGLQAGIALVLAVWFASRAIDTGSLQQYGLALLFLIIAIVKAFARSPRGQS